MEFGAVYCVGGYTVSLKYKITMNLSRLTLKSSRVVLVLSEMQSAAIKPDEPCFGTSSFPFMS